MCHPGLGEHSIFEEFSKKMYGDKHDIKEQQVVFRNASSQKQRQLKFEAVCENSLF